MSRPLAAAAIFFLCASAHAQFEFFDLSEDMVVQLGAAATSRPAAGTAKKKGADEPQSERHKRLEKLTFDRRPSAILAAWAKPPASAAPAATADASAPPADAASEGASALAEPAPLALAPEMGAARVASEESTRAPDAPPAPAADAKDDEAAAKEAAKEAEAAAKEAETKALDAELEAFQRDVTLGEWQRVKDYLGGLTEAEATAGYAQLLKSLVEGPPKPRSPFANFAETNFFGPGDMTGLAAAARTTLEPASLEQLGALLRQCVDTGNLIEQCIAGFRERLSEEGLCFDRTAVARILFGAGFPIEAGEFLPELEAAQAANERAALNLLARHFLAQHAKDAKKGFLERAWDATQAVLADGELADDDKKEALQRAVEIAPRVRDELGGAWLDESFSARPERGMEILSVIGATAAAGQVEQARDSEQRFRSLELQTTATNALIAAAPELAHEWRDALNLLATNWLKEAVYTYAHDQSTQRGPSLDRDPFGNFFYYNYRPSFNQNNMPQPITTDQMLDIRPSDGWLEHVSEALRPKVAMVLAQLLLKVNEETEAFPHIERLALTHPERAKDLVDEFLRVWAKNHDPNANDRRTNRYMFFYGFEERADGIPLTRSKQERNLAELSEWVGRLRALPIDSVDEELLAAAFTAAHSTAEVYKVETIERVFGPLGELEPKTLAELVDRMRANLVGVWRQPAEQESKKTRRRQKDIQAEIVRGYEVAAAVVDKSLADHQGEWRLVLAKAAVAHDENNYRQEIAQSTEFAGRREEAFEQFARAAALYAQSVPELREEEETTKAYETWFYASLGACELNAIDHEKQPVAAQIERVRAALEDLPGEAAERHIAMLASTLFTRMSNVAPAVKFRYVRAGLEIVGDHERAEPARDVYDYYKDLVTEIRLETRVDGDARVGHGEPFGLFVDLRHTREIEREAGGFSKYLVNQNNQPFAYNYGRPTENYRDKFEEAAREALKEHFEVLSITFNQPDAHSLAVLEYGWRVTPYAYVLLKPRGPEVDRVPALRLDLDFLDTTGYAILPIESSPLPIDALAAQGLERPFRELQVTQTLDERQAKEGKLLLEVKASAIGLVGRFDTLLELAPAGFEVVSIDDQGVSVAKFDDEGDGTEIRSERSWIVSMRAADGLAELPKSFEFASARADGTKLEYQRFVDADLASVAAKIDLEARYGKKSYGTILWWGPALGLGVLAAGFFLVRGTRTRVKPEGRFQMPERLSPFTVIGLLREIDANDGLADGDRRDLARAIDELERCYFGDDGRAQPDLRALAEAWLQRVS